MSDKGMSLSQMSQGRGFKVDRHLVKEIFHESIRPYKSDNTPMPKETEPAVAAAAAQDGYILVDLATLAASEMTKLMIKDIVAGLTPVKVGVKYDIKLADLMVRLAKYAYEQGVQNGDMTK